MTKSTILVIFILFSSTYSQPSSGPGYCTKEKQGTLEWRVKNAEVVITATINRVDHEHRYGEGEEVLNVSNGGSTPANTHKTPDHHAVGMAKLWRVVKGSIAHVTNHSLLPEGVLNDDSSKMMHIPTPIIKLYGLRNEHVCGSFLGPGDTRIFFLRKFQDFRPEMLQMTDDTSEEFDVLTVNSPGQVIANSGIKNATITAHSESEKSKKPRKNGKKRKGKKNGRKNGKKRERKRKSKKGGKRRSRRKRRKTSESTYEKFRKFRRSKRDASSPAVPSPRMHQQTMHDEPTSKLRQVLVIVSAPARITLQNLNSIESLVDRN